MVKPVSRLIVSLKKKTADVAFLVTLLGYFNPEDEIFEKSYKYKRPATAHAEIQMVNTDNILSDLPELDE